MGRGEPERTPLKKLAVLVGGPSPEHDVSLSTGSVVIRALDRARFQVVPFLVTLDFQWVVGEPLGPGDAFDVVALSKRSARPRPEALEALAGCDAAFLALHGTFGEDGAVQGLLEFLGVPYTGSPVCGAAVAMDKVLTKAVLRDAGIALPPDRLVREEMWRAAPGKVLDAVTRALGDDLVVKTPVLGSSVGVHMAKGRPALKDAIDQALQADGRALVEPRIEGREVTCAILGGFEDEGDLALPPTEIIPPEGRFFDYGAKYTPGVTREVTPPAMDDATIERIQAAALEAHRALGLTGMSRADGFVTPEGEVLLLEVNTIPGMTETSLYPQAAAAVGLGFSELLTRLVEVAIETFGDRRRRVLAQHHAAPVRAPASGRNEAPA